MARLAGPGLVSAVHWADVLVLAVQAPCPHSVAPLPSRSTNDIRDLERGFRVNPLGSPQSSIRLTRRSPQGRLQSLDGPTSGNR